MSSFISKAPFEIKETCYFCEGGLRRLNCDSSVCCRAFAVSRASQLLSVVGQGSVGKIPTTFIVDRRSSRAVLQCLLRFCMIPLVGSVPLLRSRFVSVSNVKNLTALAEECNNSRF